jgi:hypothetical protein
MILGSSCGHLEAIPKADEVTRFVIYMVHQTFEGNQMNEVIKGFDIRKSNCILNFDEETLYEKYTL